MENAATVRYGQHFESDTDIKLLEVDESLLHHLLHSSLIIKGSRDEEAVLCTSNKTYALKFVSTSNTMLLLPPPQDPSLLDVMATVSGHMELVETVPRVETLKELVCSKPYTEESENEPTDGLYTWEELLSIVQASEEELKEEMKSLMATEINGRWRTVDPKYMQDLLGMIMLTCVQQDWSLAAIPLEDLVNVLQQDGYSQHLVRHCFSIFGCRLAPDSALWKLEEERVCLHYAKQLLADCMRWKAEDFLKAWKAALPSNSGMECRIEMLRGEALITKLGNEEWLNRFSVGSLPKKPAERFATLFKERSKWDWDDLEPYLRDLRVPGQTIEAMLLKYTRKIQPTADARPVYTPR